MSGKWGVSFMPDISKVLSDAFPKLTSGFANILEAANAVHFIDNTSRSAINEVSNLKRSVGDIVTERATSFDEFTCYAATTDAAALSKVPIIRVGCKWSVSDVLIFGVSR